MTPFSLRIFVADGDPDGLRIVDRTNWSGKAVVFPRAAWAQPSVATRPELHQTGVYLLLGRNANGLMEWKDAKGRALKALQEDEPA